MEFKCKFPKHSVHVTDLDSVFGQIVYPMNKVTGETLVKDVTVYQIIALESNELALQDTRKYTKIHAESRFGFYNCNKHTYAIETQTRIVHSL